MIYTAPYVMFRCGQHYEVKWEEIETFLGPGIDPLEILGKL
jgi:hypothetical protein